MNIKIISVGELETNCYIIENDNECIIIDPGAEAIKIEGLIDKKLIGIIITHYHYDHIGASGYFKEKYNVPVYSYDNLEEGKNIIGKFVFEVIYTPGHTSDSIIIYFKKQNIMFVGDFIFYHTIGRTDLPTGDYKQMKKSIEKIKKYDNIDIYPGHGNITSLKEEKENNIYFS